MHDTTALLIELGAVILGLGILGRFAERIGFSPIPLYLLAGLAFGTGGLLPMSASEEFIATGAEIGVILLLLLLGLEYSASELVTTLKRQYPSGAVDFTLNALPGAIAALLMGWGMVAAVALAGVTWISSSGVIAKVLGDLGRLGNRETPIILGVLVLEDLAMAVYLPVLTALLAGVSLLGGSFTVLISLLTVGVVLYVALRHGRLISKAVSSDNPEMLLLVVLGLTLLVAGIAQDLQVSAAVGAFLVGIALSGEVAEGAFNLLTPLRDLFAAVFFVFFGLDTDPSKIPHVLLPALILAIVTVCTKIGTGWYAARRAGIGAKGRWRAGGTLVARGEFSIVIAGLAVGSEPKIGPLATAYVLIMVILGPLAARWTQPIAQRLGGPNAGGEVSLRKHGPAAPKDSSAKDSSAKDSAAQDIPGQEGSSQHAGSEDTTSSAAVDQERTPDTEGAASEGATTGNRSTDGETPDSGPTDDGDAALAGPGDGESHS